MRLSKVIVRIYDEASKDIVWRHFCYIPTDLFYDFKRKLCKKDHITEYLRKWIKEEFEIDISNLDKTKAAIRAKYKALYPKLFIDGTTDKQGWTRIWMTERMEKELAGYKETPEQKRFRSMTDRYRRGL